MNLGKYVQTKVVLRYYITESSAGACRRGLIFLPIQFNGMYKNVAVMYVRTYMYVQVNVKWYTYMIIFLCVDTI